MNSTVTSIFGRAAPSNQIRVYTEINDDTRKGGSTKKTHKNGKISDFYEDDDVQGLEIIKENLDVEILECDRQNEYYS